ncbi:Aste57867_15894 [Aphanomyces stellatus]|uniref:Aste57867_15894 protein n=1 Tax=Aphanomyces stellatus TaxID=120398 RepID=A0A485L581_9STRA|nr:hypothetical protein As57867_015838 [Aphanomyces stellatus]VFT92681.1 Aste57867_15894 [Aphanomyces stellatus]
MNTGGDDATKGGDSSGNEVRDDDDDSSGSSDDTIHAVPAPKINFFRQRQRKERDHLRESVTALEAQLVALQTQHAAAAALESPWRRRATLLKADNAYALLENDQLRQTLRAHIAFGHALRATTWPAPPTVSLVVDVPWRARRLSANAAQRHNAARAISWHQYTQLTRAMVAGGLVDCAVEKTSSVPKSWPGDIVVVETATCRLLAVDFEAVADTLWAVMVGGIPDVERPNFVLETFGDDVVYVDAPRRFAGLRGRNVDVIRRSKEVKRHVIVSRSILQDDVRCLDDDVAFVCNEEKWVVIDGSDGPAKTSVKFFMRSTPPQLGAARSSLEAMKEMETVVHNLMVDAIAMARGTERTVMQFL